MSSAERFQLGLKILLPLFLLLLPVAPLPHQLRSDLLQAYAAQRQGQEQLAAASFTRVVQVEAWRTDLWEPAARAAQAAGEAGQAVAAYEAAQRAGRLSFEGGLQLGILYAQQHQEARALAAWNPLWQTAEIPAVIRAEAARRSAQLSLKRGDFAAVQPAAEAWYAAVPQDTQAAFWLGLYRLAAGNDTQALPLLLQASNGDPRYREAVQALRRGIAQAAASEDGAYGRLMVGRALARLDEWLLARQVFEQAVQINPLYAEAWAFWAEARFQTGEDGRPQMEQAIALAPRSTVVRALQAFDLRRRGELQAAIEALQAVAEAEPNEPTWQMELGSLWAEQGDLQQARQFYERAAHIHPELGAGWKALALFSVTYEVDLRELGLSAARQAVLIDPRDPQALDLLGQVFLHLEDFASAERFLQRAYQSNAEYAPTLLHLGQLYLQQNDLPRAYRLLKQAQAVDPDGSAGKIATRLLQRYFEESS